MGSVTCNTNTSTNDSEGEKKTVQMKKVELAKTIINDSIENCNTSFSMFLLN